MSERSADERSLLFAGDVNADGSPRPMSVEALEARADQWPRTARTPANVTGLLDRTRELFIDGYYTYANFADAAVRSLQAVEAALRTRLDSSTHQNFAQLIDRGYAEGLITDGARDALNAGRKLRNSSVHASAVQVWTPALAAEIIRTSHVLIAELFDAQER